MKRFIFGLTALGLLSGCGIPGGLERPDPMWNREEAIQRECARARERGETPDPRCAQAQSDPRAPYIQDAPPNPPPPPPQPQAVTPFDR